MFNYENDQVDTDEVIEAEGDSCNEEDILLDSNHDSKY